MVVRQMEFVDRLGSSLVPFRSWSWESQQRQVALASIQRMTTVPLVGPLDICTRIPYSTASNA